MEIYSSFEQYLPEMKEVRSKYNRYLKEKDITKNSEERLYDYFSLISLAYTWDREKQIYHFLCPEVKDVIESSVDSSFSKVNTILATKLRTMEVKDKIDGFSSFVKDELYEAPPFDGCSSDYDESWRYKKFPLSDKIGTGCEEETNMVRFALNVKPGIGLFKKLDQLGYKHNIFYYKVIKENSYNNRADPIIIYATKNSQKDIMDDLSLLIAQYRRKDDSTPLGYTTLNNGIFIAEGIKGKQVTDLICQLLDKKKADIFQNPVDDELEQYERESVLRKDIMTNGDR